MSKRLKPTFAVLKFLWNAVLFLMPMSLYITSLNSGSNANCYYIGNRYEAILVDAGLSCRETERRMKGLGLTMEKVKAVFVSHEHSDHITGLPVLSKKYKLPVYITQSTFSNSHIPVASDLVHSFTHGIAIKIGGLSIIPFRKSHDANDPHSFMVSGDGVNIGVITDIGYACKTVTRYFSQCHAVFLESNYCEDMLANGSYTYYSKKRISSDKGHLSNSQALDLFVNHRASYLQLLVLSHLSKNNNDPSKVATLFSQHAGSTQIFVASRYEASPLFSIESTSAHLPGKESLVSGPAQLSLF